jgi:hypothetical protein
MRCGKWLAVAGLSLVWALPASGQITKGVLGIKGAQMS